MNPDPLEGEERPTVKGVMRDLKRVPIARLAATAFIIFWAILFARYSWEAPISVGPDAEWHFPPRAGEPRQTIPIATDAERALYDLRQAVGERGRKLISRRAGCASGDDVNAGQVVAAKS